MKISWITRLGVALFVAQAALAHDLHVDPKLGLDLPDRGSASSPYRTLSYACARAASTDTVRLAEGLYDQASGETFPIELRAGLTLTGSTPATTRIEHAGPGPAIVVEGAHGTGPTTIRELTVALDGAHPASIAIESSHPLTLNRCRIVGGAEGLLYLPGDDATPSVLRIEDSWFLHQQALAVDARVASDGTTPSEVVFSRNLVLGGDVSVALAEDLPGALANGSIVIAANTLAGGSGLLASQSWTSPDMRPRSAQWLIKENRVTSSSGTGLDFEYAMQGSALRAELDVRIEANTVSGLLGGVRTACAGTSVPGVSTAEISLAYNDIQGTTSGLEIVVAPPTSNARGRHRLDLRGNRVAGGLKGLELAVAQPSESLIGPELDVTVRECLLEGGDAMRIVASGSAHSPLRIDLGSTAWPGANTLRAGPRGQALVLDAAGAGWSEALSVIDARGNRWGSSSLDAIEEVVHHSVDASHLATIDFADPLRQELQFVVVPGLLEPGGPISVLAEPGTHFVAQIGDQWLGARLGDLVLTGLTVESNGGALEGSTPDEAVNGSTVPLVITSPDGVHGQSLVTIEGTGTSSPYAHDDHAAVDPGQIVMIDITANDEAYGGAEPDPTSVELLSAPSEGTVHVDGQGNALYTAPGHLTGASVDFQYRVTDTTGQQSNVATVTIGVGLGGASDDTRPDDDDQDDDDGDADDDDQDDDDGDAGDDDHDGGHVPTANSDAADITVGGTIEIEVLANDDGGVHGIDEGSVEVLQSPVHGSVSIDSSGVVTYQADPAWTNGTDVLSYRFADSNGNWSNIATVQIDLIDLGSGPLAVFDLAQVGAGSSVEIDVLANDIDPDGDELDEESIVIHQQPASGTLSVEDGRVTYTPDPGSTSSSDVFTYTVADETGLVSNIATCQIVIS